MKKTVTLSNLVKAKNDLELYIKLDQMKRLKKLFDPNFDLEDLNSSIEAKEDQLIIIKDAIATANAVTKDDDGHTTNYWIYQLSKNNRYKSDALMIQRKLETSEWLTENMQSKNSLLSEIEELNKSIDKETDKKKKTELSATKTKLKRSLTKLSSKNNSTSDSLKKVIEVELRKADVAINEIKAVLTDMNKVQVEVEIADEFKLIG